MTANGTMLCMNTYILTYEASSNLFWRRLKALVRSSFIACSLAICFLASSSNVSVLLFSCSAVFSLQHKHFQLQKPNLSLSDVQCKILFTNFIIYYFLGAQNFFGACWFLGICYKAEQVRKRCVHLTTTTLIILVTKEPYYISHQSCHKRPQHQSVPKSSWQELSSSMQMNSQTQQG